MEPTIRQKVPELLSVSVEERQNCARSLNRLAAQRYVYRCATRIENWRLASVVAAVSLLMLDFAVSATWFSQLATIVIVLSWSTEQALLVGLSTRMKDEAATIQEDFDCFVLKIPWAVHLGVDRPTEDRIAELSGRAANVPAVNEGLVDWYGRIGFLQNQHKRLGTARGPTADGTRDSGRSGFERSAHQWHLP